MLTGRCFSLLHQRCSLVPRPGCNVRQAATQQAPAASLRPCQRSLQLLQHRSAVQPLCRPPTLRRCARSSVACSASAAALAVEPPAPARHKAESVLAGIKGLLFYLWTFSLSLPLFVTMLVLAPFVAIFDKHRRLAQHFVNNIWAKVSTWPFYRVRIDGRHNLPRNDEPAVYVANHQSFLDIYTLFHLNRSFKFISKTSNFLIPIIGWSMFLTGHVKLNRTDRKSQVKCLSECRDLLSKGASVLFFPEGTRSKTGQIAEFKKGAFSIAAKAKVPVIPITLVGTGRIMPNGQESKMYPGNVHVIVHPAIEPKDANEMLAEAFDLISDPFYIEQRQTE